MLLDIDILSCLYGEVTQTASYLNGRTPTMIQEKRLYLEMMKCVLRMDEGVGSNRAYKNK